LANKNKIRLAIAGVGNATSALIQSFVKYSENGSKDNQQLTYNQIGGYSVGDIEVVSAFDVNKTKVNQSLDKGIFAEPNVTPKYVNIEELKVFNNVMVKKGPLLDGINETVSSLIKIDDSPEIDLVKELKASEADILLVLIPSGADKAVEAYAKAALEAGCAFINGTPTQIASDPKWAQKFKRAGLPLVGDDLQSQVGGTRLHKGILELLNNLGADVVHTYQLDVSGGAEGLTTLDSTHRLRLMKSQIKTASIKRAIPNLANENIASGTTDYLDFLGNQRIGHFWIKANDFLGGPIHIDMTVKSFDGPNAAGVLVDVIRATQLAINRTVDGPAISISAYGFKNPPVYIQESEAGTWFREFIDAKRLV
jgi:myo-inositol-1-phosphate synthase